jgi:predicted DCC family thiol-disulfide oxidoreductase YuxK
MPEPTDPPILLYDGVCGFCNGAVQFILARDRVGTLRFTPLQSDVGEGVKARHPFLRDVDSVVFLAPSDDPSRERVWIRSAAALKVAEYLGGAWRLLLVFRLVPAPLRDVFYDLFARYRYRFFGKHESCMLPSRDVRSRFIGEF